MAPQRAIIVVDLGYGDAGKGATVDFLCRSLDATSVVRYCGGAQAGHNVVDGDTHHTFAQWGSGTLVPGVKTHLSKHMVVNPRTMLTEAKVLLTRGIDDAWERHSVHRDALVTTRLHEMVNQDRERARGPEAHGSTGMGVGETVSDALTHPEEALRAGDLVSSSATIRKISAYAQRMGMRASLGYAAAESTLSAAQYMTVVGDGHLARLLSEGTTIFEGAQGVLLDQSVGFHPYTTWSDVTTRNADSLLLEAGDDRRAQRIGVIRAYGTRHGPGPFVTEDEGLYRPEAHNTQISWTGKFRVGHLDLVAIDYAYHAIGGVDCFAVNHLDKVDGIRQCIGYEMPSGETIDRLPVMEGWDNVDGALTRFVLGCKPHYVMDDRWMDRLPARVEIHSYGPRAADRKVLAPSA